MADKPLEGKIALITGGGRGMGRAMARAFAMAGAKGICVTSGASPDEVAEAAAEIDRITGRASAGLGLIADVRDAAACRDAVTKTVKHFGALHILVNNAGLGMKNVGDSSRGRFWECRPDGWDKLIATNVNGPFHMAHAAAPHLIEAGWGRILNMSKNADTMHSERNSPYGPSKAAVEAMSICWAQDLIGTGVTSNTILPSGFTNTTFSRPAAVPRAREVGRKVYEPEEIAPLAVALASEISAHYSGCRFNARSWDDTLSPEDALEACRTLAVFPKPKRERALLTGWEPLKGT